MARPSKVVKSPVATAIAELRQRLGLTQQGFAQLLEVNLATVGRWEVNYPPERKLHERLIKLADENGFGDLRDILYAVYRGQYELGAEGWFASDVVIHANHALDLVAHLPTPETKEAREVLTRLKRALQNLNRQATAVVKEMDATQEKTSEPTKKKQKRKP